MKLACDAALVVGFAAAVLGFWMMWHPAGWMIGGLGLMASAFFIGYGQKR